MLVSVNTSRLLVVLWPAVQSHILTFRLSLTVGSAVVVSETGGCPEVAGELVRAGMDPGASAVVLGCVVGCLAVESPPLVWSGSGSKVVLSSCVGAWLGWGLDCSLLSPREVGLAARDSATASVLKKCNEKHT